jgi:hypothetical protein
MPFEEIAQLEDIQACRRNLLAAFEKERFFRRVAAEKPLLTPVHRAARLTWARIHVNWDFNIWKRVVWTDESSFTTGGFGKVYVTRQVEEKYLDECLVPKFRGYSSWIIAGAISGIANGPLLFFEKEWGKINSEVYSTRALP